LAPYNVTITQVSDPALANLTLDTGTTSAAGSASGGVLGCFNGAAGEITILQGWSWYAGADATQIGAGQYDFQTTITHEFGHALGLGHVADPNSPMYESLATGTAHRVMTVADLNIPLPPVGADPLLAAPRPAKGYAGPGLVQGINLAPATAAAFVITPVTTSGPAPLSMKQAHLPSGDRSAAFVPLGVTDAGWRDVAAGSAEDAELWPGVAEEWLPPVTQPAGAVPAVKPFDDVAQGWPHTSSAENPNAEREICTNAVDSAFAWMADDMDDYEW
jgi:hypothetical protein